MVQVGAGAVTTDRTAEEADGHPGDHGEGQEDHAVNLLRSAAGGNPRSSVAAVGSSEVRYEVADRVARITIDREARRNALSWDVVRELRAAFARAKADDDVVVVVLTGAGEKAFCAGADLDGMASGAEPDRAPRGPRRAGRAVPGPVRARQADHRPRARLRAGGRVRLGLGLRPRGRLRRRGVRHARDRPGAVAPHDHGAPHPGHAAQAGARADAHRAARGRGGGGADRLRHPRRARGRARRGRRRARRRSWPVAHRSRCARAATPSTRCGTRPSTPASGCSTRSSPSPPRPPMRPRASPPAPRVGPRSGPGADEPSRPLTRLRRAGPRAPRWCWRPSRAAPRPPAGRRR